MTQRKNFSWLLRELKRRNVFRVVAMYAPAAFILLELMDIITPALALPPWTVTLTIIVIAVGFPVTVILSWIFDITPEGIRKTGELEETSAVEPELTEVRRKLRASDVVIAVLVIVLGVLIYPKIFSGDQLSGIRDKAGKISVAVLPFENLAGDSALNVWQGGFQNLLITTLSNSEEISVRQYQTVSSVLEQNANMSYASLAPSKKSDLARKLETRTLILGNILKSGELIRINAQLVDAETEEVYKTYLVEGGSEDDFFAMADELSNLIKNYVEIKNMQDRYGSPAIRGLSSTHSSEAFKYFIHGIDAFNDLELATSAEWFRKSVEADSTFVSPYVELVYVNNLMGYTGATRYWLDKIYDQREEASLQDGLMIDHVHAYFYGTPDEEMKFLNQLVEIDELNPLTWQLYGFAHYKIGEYEEALSKFERAMEINEKWGKVYKNPFIYLVMGHAYHKVGEHGKEAKTLEQGLSLYPTYINLYECQAICALSKGETEKANKIMAEYKDIRENVTHCTEAMIAGGFGYIYEEAGILDKAEQYYRHIMQLQPGNAIAKNNFAYFLINREVDVKQGIELVDEALEALPDNWAVLGTKGWGLYKQGQLEEALALLKVSWEGRPAYIHSTFVEMQTVEQALAQLN